MAFRYAYEYDRYRGIGNDWERIGGRWREARDPTIGEVSLISGGGGWVVAGGSKFRGFRGQTYVEILTYMPKYVAFMDGVG